MRTCCILRHPQHQPLRAFVPYTSDVLALLRMVLWFAPACWPFLALLREAEWGCVAAEQVQWKDLEIQKQIGEGSFGKVFLAKWRETTVAVKQLTYTGVSGSMEDNDEFIQQGMNVLLQGLEQVSCLRLIPAWHHLYAAWVFLLGAPVLHHCFFTAGCSTASLQSNTRAMYTHTHSHPVVIFLHV